KGFYPACIGSHLNQHRLGKRVPERREISIELAIPVFGAFISVIVIPCCKHIGNDAIEPGECLGNSLPLFLAGLVTVNAVWDSNEILFYQVAGAQDKHYIQLLAVFPYPCRHHLKYTLVSPKF